MWSLRVSFLVHIGSCQEVSSLLKVMNLYLVSHQSIFLPPGNIGTFCFWVFVRYFCSLILRSSHFNMFQPAVNQPVSLSLIFHLSYSNLKIMQHSAFPFLQIFFFFSFLSPAQFSLLFLSSIFLLLISSRSFTHFFSHFSIIIFFRRSIS